MPERRAALANYAEKLLQQLADIATANEYPERDEIDYYTSRPRVRSASKNRKSDGKPKNREAEGKMKNPEVEGKTNNWEEEGKTKNWEAEGKTRDQRYQLAPENLPNYL